MSATGRQPAQRSLPTMGYQRQVDDWYATPAWATRAIWPHVNPGLGLIVDPCCGDGAILDVLNEMLNHDRGPGTGLRLFPLLGFELSPARSLTASERGHRIETRDALADALWSIDGEKPFLIITNPPFKLAMPFVERALAEVAEGGSVCMLLRLSWLASTSRAAFHRAHPADVFVLPRRPSFTANGKSDSADYAWFRWRAGRGGRWSVLETEASS